MSTERSSRLDEVLAQNLRHERQLEEVRPANRAALFDVLAAAGIALVTVEFDGYGDNGQMEAPRAFDAAGKEVELPAGTVPLGQPEWGKADVPTKDVPVTDGLEGMAYDLLHDRHAGWENGEGAFGEFTLDVAARTITLECRVRYVDSDLYTYEL